MRIALVSCVKLKRDHAAPAGELYISPLFQGLKGYAEASADAWCILSAEHGLLTPDQVIAPYERTLNKMNVTDRRRWAARVLEKLDSMLSAPSEIVILAGQRYRELLVPALLERGHKVEVPLEGLSMGRQLQRLAELRAERAAVHITHEGQ
jgi:hypothetical protein